jgi:Peptidase M76 family
MRMQAGCRFPKERIVVAECEPGYLGRFLKHELEICYNNYQGGKDELRNTIVHELIHAYDQCRAKDMDWSNCKHIACSEVSSDTSLVRVGICCRLATVLTAQCHADTSCAPQWRLLYGHGKGSGPRTMAWL